jgi:hypothetical protein
LLCDRLEELSRPVPDSGARRSRTASAEALRKDLTALVDHLTAEIDVSASDQLALPVLLPATWPMQIACLPVLQPGFIMCAQLPFVWR